MKKNYESPKMTLVNVQSDETVANVCWGGSGLNGTGRTWEFYGADLTIQEPRESDPEGWFTFQIVAKSCKEANGNVSIVAHGEAARSSEAYNKLMAEFYTKVDVSNGGSPWAGEGTVTPILGSK